MRNSTPDEEHDCIGISRLAADAVRFLALTLRDEQRFRLFMRFMTMVCVTLVLLAGMSTAVLLAHPSLVPTYAREVLGK
ncbi:hypothetical protein OHS58_34020 [Amycolatopsis sp. NBC_00348]|uniref:hypothetical protein n=1 Tax=Amycolatopsis sp. NBC_00348 TaxID=2975956 RepID=UPI002E253912